MRCREIEILIPEYVSGLLTEEDTRKVALHTDLCPSCRQELADTRRLLSVTRSVLPAREPAPEGYFGQVWADLYAAIQERGLHRRAATWQESLHRFILWPTSIRMPLFNTALVLLVAAALWISLRQDVDRPPTLLQDFRNEITASGGGRIGRSLQQGREAVARALTFGVAEDTGRNLETVIDALHPEQPEGEAYDRLTDYLAQFLVKLDRQG